MKWSMPVSKSIIVSADVSIEKYEKILQLTKDNPKIGGYKIGFVLGLTYGLPKIVQLTRKYTNKPIIYDHQKAATDIPDTGVQFMKVCKDAGIDCVILFPHTGPSTQAAWIKAAQDANLGLIVGGMMTHPNYRLSEGGYIDDKSIFRIYLDSAKMGVRDFVVPGNKPEFTKELLAKFKEQKIENVIFYAPGFITQGGNITESAKVAGKSFHAIVGRGIYEAIDMDKAIKEYCSQI